MATPVQVTFDSLDPHRLARFWAAALGYEKEDHTAVVAALVRSGVLDAGATLDVDGGPQFADASACRDPDGHGPRLYFQKVPEAKAGKNRIHLDLHKGADQQEAELARLEVLGARKLWFSDDRGGPCWTMADIEGNEFCIN